MGRSPRSDGHEPPAPSAGRALLHLACETLALGCLFERRGEAFIRIPVQRRQQMMGCEWHCRREGGLLRRVSYTFEAMEDWIALAREGPERVAALYRGILGRPEIREAELIWHSDVFVRTPDGYVPAFRAGSYNPLNAWNTVRGAVHLNGCAEAGFEAPARPGAAGGRLRLAGGAPERGLLFLGGRDCTAAVLHATRRDGAADCMQRIELSVPVGEDWSLGELTLPDGERFSPLGLFRALLGGEEDALDSLAAARPGEAFLPGPMISEALLRQVRPAPVALAVA